MTTQSTINEIRKEIESLKKKNEGIEIYVVPIEKDGSKGEKKLLLTFKGG